ETVVHAQVAERHQPSGVRPAVAREAAPGGCAPARGDLRAGRGRYGRQHRCAAPRRAVAGDRRGADHAADTAGAAAWPAVPAAVRSGSRAPFREVRLIEVYAIDLRLTSVPRHEQPPTDVAGRR